jgi:hypothetical protein
MSGIVQDLRYALRGLRRNPAFTSVALVTLALGIGANTAMFSVLNAVLLRPLPYPAPHELAMLWTERPNQNLREGRSAYRDVEEWRARSRTLADVGVFDPMTARLTAPGELERISTLRLSPNIFAILGVQAYRGRVFSIQEADERRRVAVVSYRFWQSRLGGADNVIGSTIELDGLPSEVIGILPADFRWSDSDVWEPHTLFPDWDVRRGERGDASWFVLARFRPNVTIEQAQGELSIHRAASRRATDRVRTGTRHRRDAAEPAHRWTTMAAGPVDADGRGVLRPADRRDEHHESVAGPEYRTRARIRIARSAWREQRPSAAPVVFRKPGARRPFRPGRSCPSPGSHFRSSWRSSRPTSSRWRGAT